MIFTYFEYKRYKSMDSFFLLYKFYFNLSKNDKLS